jgi:O-antigen/teichoic acid export membrane protein
LGSSRGRRAGLDRGRGTRLGLNAVLNLAGSVAYYVAVVLVTPLAIHHLGDEAWGIWMLVGAATNYALLLNLGLNSAIAYHVSSSVATGDLEGLGRSIRNARLYLVGAAAAISVGFLLFGRWLVTSLVPESSVGVAFLALAVSALLTVVTLPLRVFTSVLSGVQRFDLLAGFRLIAGFVLLIGVALGFAFGMGLPGFAGLMTLAPALPGVFAWVASRRLLPRECFEWRRGDWAHLRGMLTYSVNTVPVT